MAATDVAEVVVTRSDLANPRFTPRELRLIQEHTGKTMSALLADEDGDDKFVVFGWLKLRRDGHDIPFDEMDDVVLAFNMTEHVPDPTNGQRPATSPGSAATGA